MKIVIPGGTGQIGTFLAREFTALGHDVTVLSRTHHKLPWRVVHWDAEHLDSWAAELEGADVVINLAGRSVNCRYTPANRKLILESRVRSTRIIGQAIAAAKNPPAVWLQMGTATIYAHRYDAPNDEFTGILGGTEDDAPDTWRFSIQVAKAWEKALEDAVAPQNAQSSTANRDDHEPRSRRCLRRIIGSHTPRPRGNQRERSPVCVVDP